MPGRCLRICEGMSDKNSVSRHLSRVIVLEGILSIKRWIAIAQGNARVVREDGEEALMTLSYHGQGAGK